MGSPYSPYFKAWNLKLGPYLFFQYPTRGKKVMRRTTGISPSFLMSGYMIDSVSAITHFSLLSWNWSLSQDLVHIHCSKLWDVNWKDYFYEICNHFIITLHMASKNQPTPRFNQEAMDTIKEVEYWFIDEAFYYIIIYACEGETHIFPIYVLDRMVLREIVYQTKVLGLIASLSKIKNKQWPSFPIPIGIYFLLNSKHSLK
jgi:hypothetical protein